MQITGPILVRLLTLCVVAVASGGCASRTVVNVTEADRAPIAHVPQDGVDDYIVTLGDLDDRRVTVTANLWLHGDKIHADWGGMWFDPNRDSFWEIITIDNITAADGEPIGVATIDSRSAHLDRRVDGRVTIDYTVDISYVDEELFNGNTRRRGKSFDDGYFLVGKSLFIKGHYNQPATVRVKYPRDLVFSAPWSFEDGVYHAGNGFLLTQTNVVLGRHAPVDIRATNLDYSVVTLGLKDQTTEIINLFAQETAAYYLETFPLGRTATYMQVAIWGKTGGGEAYLESSTSSLVEERLDSLVWRFTFAHELFHMWNTQSLNAPESSDMEWFKEGFTDFITDTALEAIGEMDFPQAEARRKRTYRRFAKGFQAKETPVSIAGAGAEKRTSGDHVYRGGCTAAIWLDRSLIRETNGQWNMVEFMKMILREFGAQGRTLDLPTLMSEMAKIDPNIGRDFETIITSSDWNTIHELLTNDLYFREPVAVASPDHRQTAKQ